MEVIEHVTELAMYRLVPNVRTLVPVVVDASVGVRAVQVIEDGLLM